jgi:hypothetical protein
MLALGRCKICGCEGAAECFSKNDSNLCNKCAEAASEHYAKQNQFEPENTVDYSRFNKVLLTLYAIVCLVIQTRVAIRWGGHIIFGIFPAIISFGIPPLIALLVSSLINKSNKKHYFTPILFGMVLFCSILLWLFYSFMSSVHY